MKRTDRDPPRITDLSGRAAPAHRALPDPAASRNGIADQEPGMARSDQGIQPLLINVLRPLLSARARRGSKRRSLLVLVRFQPRRPLP
jgi:hypothetical protein